VDFVAPIKLGSLLEMKAFIITTGRSSLTVEVNAVSETLSDGVRITAIRGRFIMVAVDANGQPRPLPQDNSEIVIKKEKEINETA
jgi:acyl-CoA hydrolase